MVFPNGKRFYFLRKAPVKRTQYGKTEEYYQCENCEGCPRKEKCHKSSQSRTVQANEELAQFHEEVLENLNSIHGALLRMNRSYKRWHRSWMDDVIFEPASYPAVLIENFHNLELQV